MVKNDYYNEFKGKYFNGDYPTIQEALEITVSRHPELLCFVSNAPVHVSMTFSEVHEAVKRIGSYLIEKGISKGDKVGLDGKNSISWALAYLSVSYAGASVVPLDNQMESEKVERLLPFSGARLFFADSDVLSRVHLSKEIEVIDLGKLEGLVPAALHPKAAISCSDTLSMLFTSGTTGNEKCVVLSHANIMSDAFMACSDDYLSLRTDDVMFALLPLHHAYCCTAVLIETILNGNSCLFGQGMTPSKIISDMKSGHVTFMMGIPMIYNKFLSSTMRKIREKGRLKYFMFALLMRLNGFSRKVFNVNHGRKWFSQVLESLGMMDLNVCICGAGPLSPKTFKAFQRLGIDFIQGYGLTETSPILALNPVKRFKVKSVGQIFPDIEAKIIDPDLMGIGELAVKGPCCTKGYYNDPASTAELFTEDGYLKTGDLGVLDKKRYLYLKGRAKNIIVTEGGKNVFPEEIEEHFQLYPQIGQIMVRGFVQNRSTMSEELEAVIYPAPEYFKGKSEQEVSDEIHGIVSSVNAKSVSYKKIARISIASQPMSMTTTKKIQRSKVARSIDNLIRMF